MGGDGNAKPYLIKWQKGDERIEVIRDYKTLSASTFAVEAEEAVAETNADD